MAVFTAIGTALGASIAGSALLGGAAVVAGAVGTVATVKSVKSSKAAAQTAVSVAQAQVQQQKVAATRQRRQSVRSFIRRRSQLRAAAAAGGIQGSGVAGGLASLSSQYGANLGFGSQMGALSGQITTLSGIQATQQAQSGMYSNIASLGFGLAGAGMKYGDQLVGAFPDQLIGPMYGPMRG